MQHPIGYNVRLELVFAAGRIARTLRVVERPTKVDQEICGFSGRGVWRVETDRWVVSDG